MLRNALRFGWFTDVFHVPLIEASVLHAGSLFYFCLNMLGLFVREQQSASQCLLHLFASPLRLHHSRAGVTVDPSRRCPSSCAMMQPRMTGTSNSSLSLLALRNA